MVSELEQIEIPDYPSGSFNFIRRLRHLEPYQACLSNGVKSRQAAKVCEQALAHGSHVKLDIVIIGAGVSGLSNAIALRLDGHRVRVYEQASALSEIGAGIQVPPNSSRILLSWGLGPALRRKSVTPKFLLWLRWEDGTAIGRSRLNPESEERFDAPYYVIHRAHLHQVLHERAHKLGVPIILKHRASSFDPENGVLTFEGGEVVEADLVIAADGLKSPARSALNETSDQAPCRYHLAAHRAAVEMAQIRADPVTSWIADSPNLNFWVGLDAHVMSYAIAGGELYNIVLTHKRREDDEPVLSNEDELKRMRSFYEGWDPSLTKLLGMVRTTLEWPIQQINIPERWASVSGKMIISGDAAHAMLPNMALGAAMAVEDAAALAATLRHLKSRNDLPTAIEKWVMVRKPRNQVIREASIGHGIIFHLPDGPLQQARDEAMAVELTATDFTESPDQWADPAMVEYAYGYDAAEEIERAWHET